MPVDLTPVDDVIADLLDAPGNGPVRERAHETVSDLCTEHPLSPADPSPVEA